MAEPGTQAPQSSRARTQQSLEQASILVIDDKATNLYVLDEILRRHGFTNVTLVDDSTEAVAAFEECKADVVLLDLHMPQLDGLEVMERLNRIMPADAPVPVLVITGDDDSEQRTRALSAGAKDFLTKPFDPVEVLLRIENLLETRYLTLRLVEQACQSERAKIAADEANFAKSEFLSRMSHELRTPLNAVLGFAQLLDFDATAPAQKEGIAEIVKAGAHLLDLINELLDIAAIESRRVSVSMQATDAVALARECVALLGPVAHDAGITLEVHAGNIATSQRQVLADRQRLKQVLLNLITNGIKYNRERGLVTVSFCLGDDERYLRIAVSDTGYGIAEHKFPQLFAPFERLGANESAIEGTGLGLTLAKSLVEAMAGTISVASDVGKGTRFSVDLRRTDDSLGILEQKASQATA